MSVIIIHAETTFHISDLVIYISSFIDDLILLPFVLTCKVFLEAAIASHRHFHKSSLSYYCRRVEMMQWALELNPPNHSKLMQFAALDGTLDVIQWLRNQNPPCPWDEVTCSIAAKNGHFDILLWLRNQDPPCPWDEDICLKFTARYRRVEELKLMEARESKRNPNCVMS